jgi:recombination protein RecA
MGRRKSSTTPTEAPESAPELTQAENLAKVLRLAQDNKIKLLKASELKPFKFLQSGLPQIDALGGPCLGRFVVIYGPKGGGKTTYLYRCIANAQKNMPNKITVLVDAEGRIDPSWMEAQGVDLEKLMVIQGHDTLEDYCNALRLLMNSGAVSIAAIDTISAMTPREMKEEAANEKNLMNRNFVARDATKIQQFIRLTKEDIFKNEVACVIVSQARTHGIGGRHTYVGLSGGNMLMHMALQIWQFTVMGNKSESVYRMVSVDGRPTKLLESFHIKALLEKDTGPNTRQVAYLPFTVGVGYDTDEAEVGAALRYGCIPEVARYSYRWTDNNGEEVKLRGRDNVKIYFRQHPEEREKLKDLIALAHHQTAEPLEDIDDDQENNEQEE